MGLTNAFAAASLDADFVSGDLLDRRVSWGSSARRAGGAVERVSIVRLHFKAKRPPRLEA